MSPAARKGRKAVRHAAAETAANLAPITANNAPEFRVYWILKLWGGRTAAEAEFFGISVYDNPMPHEGVGHFGYESPREMMKDLRRKGWKPSRFTDSEHQCFARIEVTPCGFNLVRFPSYAAAMADHRARMQKSNQSQP